MTPEARLAELGLQLPQPFAPPTNFVPAVQSRRLLFLSGPGPTGPAGKLLIRGRLGADLALEQGYEAARATALALLGSLKGANGELDRLSRIVKLLGLRTLHARLRAAAGRHRRSIGLSCRNLR